MNIILRYYNLKGLHIFIGIVLANIFLVWISKTLLINEVVFYNAFSDQLTYERSQSLFENMNKFSWISYAFTPIILLIKFSLISLVLYFGVVFYNLQDRISLGSIFKIVIASEFIFLVASFLKFLWFEFFAGNYDFKDLSFFYPFALINFFRKAEISPVWIYPLQTVNLFHILYILTISFALNKVCCLEKNYSEKIVLITYLPALTIWIALVMFLTIDLTL